MTKERRLAIQMWDMLRAHIRDAERLTGMANTIARLKYRFMVDHNLHWRHGCWFCQYVRYYDKVHGSGCQRCPLSDGSSKAIKGDASGCANGAYYRVLYARTREAKTKSV